MTRIFLIVALSLAGCGMRVAHAQDSVLIDRGQACRTCRFEFVKLATLGGETEEQGLISVESKVVRDSKGRFYVAPTHDRGRVVRYDERGKPSGLIGRRGRGPGEHLSIADLAIAPADTLIVLDPGNARWTVWDPAGTFVRVARLPGYPWDAVASSNGGLVLQASIRSRETAGLPIHLLDASGKIVRSFGSRLGELRPDRATAQFRAIALTGRGTIWSGNYDRYAIQEWTLEGELARTLTSRVDWFPPHSGPVPGPEATLRALSVDEFGRVWVLIQIPDAKWKSSADDLPKGPRDADRSVDDREISVV